MMLVCFASLLAAAAWLAGTAAGDATSSRARATTAVRVNDSSPRRIRRVWHRTTEQEDTIHVNIVGRPLEVYTSGTHAMPIEVWRIAGLTRS